MHDFQWFTDRLEIAHRNGPGDFHAACPVCGGSDPLHVTEKNGRALLKCFSCGAGYVEVVERLEDDGEVVDEDAGQTPVRAVRIGRRGGARKTEAGRVERTVSGDARPRQGRGVRLPSASTISPLEWMAARCGLTVADLAGLPLSEDGTDLVFEFPGVEAQKRRGVGEGKAEKRYSWRGASNPPLWPVPSAPEKEIAVCEGEADAICLRHSGYDAYSITKGSQGGVPDAVWSSLRAGGVESVRLIYDLDDAGRKGRAAAAESARDAGLHVTESRVAGIDPLLGEKDARDVALRLGYPLELEDDADEDLPVLLSDVEPMIPDDPLLDRLHPQEHTILYGDGGTGKGVVAAWWVARLTRAPLRKKVLVVDYEYHMNYEWRPRVEGFGGDMSRVAVVQPIRPIWEIAGWLRTQALEYDYVVVDSVTYACVGEEVEKSVTATKYSMAVNQLMKPVLSIAHVTKQNQDPNHPFGSIFWSNGARVTISISRQRPEEPDSPRVLRNPKTNQRGPFHPVTIDWGWLGNDGPPGCECKSNIPPDQRGMPRHLHETAVTPNKRQAIRDVRAILMASLGREPTATEVHGRLTTEYPDIAMTEEHVKTALSQVRRVDKPVPVARRRSGQNDPDGV